MGPRSVRMKAPRAIYLSLLFVLMGLVGGAIRYWRWWPSHSGLYSIVSGIACPLCPNIDGINTDWDKFVSRTLVGGVINMVPALVVGWLVVGIRAGLKHKPINSRSR